MPSFIANLNGVIAAVALVATLHLSVLLNLHWLGILAIAAFCVLKLTGWIRGNGVRGKLAAGLVAGVVLIVLSLSSPSIALNGKAIFYAPPLLLNAYFFLLFARSLLPGREPLITRFCRLERGAVPPPLEQYTRRLTMAWAIFLAAVTAEVVLLAVLVDLKIWSWYANVLNPLVALIFFFAEYPYRFWRYGQFGPYSLRRTLRVILQREAWITE